MAMQRMLTDPNFEDDVHMLNCSQVQDSQVSSPHMRFMYSQSQLLSSESFPPNIPSSSPMYNRVPPITPYPPMTQPTMAMGTPTMTIGTPPAMPMMTPPPMAGVVAKKGVKRGSQGSAVGGAIDEGTIKAKRARGKKKVRDSQGMDDEGEGEIGRAPIWKDFWVVTLIHERGGLNEEFNKPQKQGTDLWSKIANKLASTYSNFDKDSEACRKKWGRVYDLYKADKLHNSISGNDIKKTCKWYDLVDEYMHDRAHVRVYSHASATGEPALGQETNVPEEPNTLHAIGKPPTPLTGNKALKKDAQMDELIASAKETTRGILAHLQQSNEKKDAAEARREAMESKRMDILETVASALVRFMDHVSSK